LAPASEPDGKPRLSDWIGVLAMCAGLVMAIMDVQIVTSSLTQIQGGLSASSAEIAWVQTAYLIADVVMVPLSGMMSLLTLSRSPTETRRSPDGTTWSGSGWKTHRHCGSRRPRSATLRESATSPDIAIVRSRICFTDSRAKWTTRSGNSWSGTSTRHYSGEGARPVIFHTRGATCWHPRIKGLTTMVNSMYNGWRMEDVWLER
jgi:hypothetical protein